MPRTGVRFNVRDSRRFREFLEQLDPRDRASVPHRVLVDLTRLIQADVRENQIVRGRPLESDPLPKKLTWRTGHLTRSIGIDNSQAPKRYVVGTPVEYGPQHELGLSPYPKRPFLQPAATKVIQEDAPKLFRIALNRAAGR